MIVSCMYSETSLIRHSMGPEKNVGLGGCWIMECLLPYLRMYGDCTSYNGRIRENVGLERCWISEISLYVHVRTFVRVLAVSV